MLDIPVGEAWERTMALSTWVNDVVLADDLRVNILLGVYFSYDGNCQRAVRLSKGQSGEEGESSRTASRGVDELHTIDCADFSYLQFPLK